MNAHASIADTPSRVLVCYYSLGGHTRALAEEIRGATGGEIEELRERRPRGRVLRLVGALVDTVRRRDADLAPVRHDPSNFDLLILGGPIWGGRLAAPVRAYAGGPGRHARRIAMFCTHGSPNTDAAAAFIELEELCGRERVASLALPAERLPAERHGEALRRFVRSLDGVPVAGVWTDFG